MKFKQQKGFSLIELMMVVAILGLIGSVMSPHIDMIVQRAYQAQAKGNLAVIRTGINLYYADTEGWYPLAGYPEGDTHYTANGQSLALALDKKYITHFPMMKLMDRNPSYNGLGVSYDNSAQKLLSMTPPKVCFIVHSTATYIPGLPSAFGYNNQDGTIFISNGNYDVDGNYFFSW